ncbi:hypothetical protein [Paenibacillus sp. FSL H3-0333]|uniref:hypothetical protein n=1 Tax=Paenibacillus sp. FSL H3-0333 TaxID=2921373 RepID=UPI0030F9BE61
MDKDHILAAYSMADVVFNSRGLNAREKRLLVYMFNATDPEDWQTRFLIVNQHTEVFNLIM